jgi:hypothetical protein
MQKAANRTKTEIMNEAAFVIDHSRMELAIEALVQYAGGLGIGSGDLVQMLDSGIGISEILEMLEERARRRVH